MFKWLFGCNKEEPTTDTDRFYMVEGVDGDNAYLLASGWDLETVKNRDSWTNFQHRGGIRLIVTWKKGKKEFINQSFYPADQVLSPNPFQHMFC